MADHISDKVCRDHELIHQACFEKCLFNLLCLYSFPGPCIAHTNAVLEHEAAEDMLSLAPTMRENTNRARAIDAGARELADFNIIPLSRRHSLPACCRNGSVKRGAAISRKPIAHRNHAAQHGRRDIVLARGVLEGTCQGLPNRRRRIQKPTDRSLDGSCLTGEQECRGHDGAVLPRHTFRTLRQQRMEHEMVAVGLFHEIGDKAKHISEFSRIGIVSARLASLFEQALDDTAQIFAKIELGSTKTLNKK